MNVSVCGSGISCNYSNILIQFYKGRPIIEVWCNTQQKRLFLLLYKQQKWIIASCNDDNVVVCKATSSLLGGNLLLFRF